MSTDSPPLAVSGTVPSSALATDYGTRSKTTFDRPSIDDLLSAIDEVCDR